MDTAAYDNTVNFKKISSSLVLFFFVLVYPHLDFFVTFLCPLNSKMSLAMCWALVCPHVARLLYFRRPALELRPTDWDRSGPEVLQPSSAD